MLLERLGVVVLIAFTLTWLTLRLVRTRRVRAGRLLLLLVLLCIVSHVVARWDRGWLTALVDLSLKLTLLLDCLAVLILALARRLPDLDLRVHRVSLREGDLLVRPLTEKDWPLLLSWNNDPEVLALVEGEGITGRTRQEVQDLYRSISQTGLLFMIEVRGRPVGECWLQTVHQERLLTRFPGRLLRRLDLLIGDKALWGQGYGPRVIGLLTDLAFAQGADGVVAVAIAADNVGARRAFAKVGYTLTPDTVSAEERQQTADLVLWRTAWADAGGHRAG